MIKPFFHITPPQKVVVPPTSSLPSLYKQQRTLSAAKNVTADPIIHQALDQKQALMSRRIAQLQAREKAI